MSATRDYDSSLREQQAEMTRERVLEGLIRVIVTDGVGELSIPSVATESGVSVPTIYRHFGSKSGLVDALGEYVASKSGLRGDVAPVDTVDELVDLIGEMYRRSAAMEPAHRAAMATDVGQEARRQLMPERLESIEIALSKIASDLNEPELTRLRDLVLILASSAVMRAFKDYLDMDSEQAAETVEWGVRLIVKSVTKEELG